MLSGRPHSSNDYQREKTSVLTWLICAIIAGFTPSEADKLRRAMATFRRVGTIQTFQDRMIAGLTAKGYDREFAERCFRQIEGFGEYGFPESHAASFALLVWASN